MLLSDWVFPLFFSSFRKLLNCGYVCSALLLEMHTVQRSIFLAFPCLLPTYHFCFIICYSSFLVSSFSFYLSRTLKSSGWWLKSSKYVVCSPSVHFTVICGRKSGIRNSSTLYHPPLYVTHPGLSSRSFSICFFFFFLIIDY